MLDTLRSLKKSSNKAKLSSESKPDIKWWWVSCLPTFKATYFHFVHLNHHTITSEASLTGAGAAIDKTGWYYLDWNWDIQADYSSYINLKETLAVAYAIYRSAPHLQNSLLPYSPTTYVPGLR